ncbi:MAG TPA: hypothetical protein ENI44_01095 [Thermoplasmatales archaeon]|nr:hypothetical protein [Thermoplasmatales archaeon]
MKDTIIDKLLNEENEKKKMPFRYITMDELLKEESDIMRSISKIIDVSIDTARDEGNSEDIKEPEFSIMREDTPIDLTLVGVGDVKTIEAVIRRHENKRHRMEIS